MALGIVGFLLLAVVFFALGYFFLGPRISPTSLSAQNNDAQEKPGMAFDRPSEPDSSADIPDLKITRHTGSNAKPKEIDQPAKESAPKEEENSITVTMDSGNGSETELKDKTPSKAETPAPKPKTRSSAKSERSSGGTYRVQVGAYGNRDNAERLAEELANRGYSAAVRSSTSGDRTLYRVQLGTFKSRSDVQSLVGHLEDDGYQPAVSTGD